MENRIDANHRKWVQERMLVTPEGAKRPEISPEQFKEFQLGVMSALETKIRRGESLNQEDYDVYKVLLGVS